MLDARTEVNRILATIPDEKMMDVLNLLQSMNGFAHDEEIADEFDLMLLAEDQEGDHDVISFEDAVNELGLTLGER